MHPSARFRLLALFAVCLAPLSTGCLAPLIAGILGTVDAVSGSNTAPAVIVGQIARGLGDVQIPVVVLDTNNDAVTLQVEFSLDGTTFATPSGAITPTTVTGSSAGTSATLTWSAAADLGATFRDTVFVRITPADKTASGTATTSMPFSHGNDAPAIANLAVDLGTDDTVSGNAVVRFDLLDSAGDPVSIIGFEFSSSGTFVGDTVAVALTVGPAGNFPSGSLVGLVTSAAGDSHSLVWASLRTAVLNSLDARIRMQVEDSFGASSTVEQSAAFFLLNQTAPSALLLSIKKPDGDGRRSGIIEVIYRLVDEQNDTCDVTVEFSVDDGETWNACTPAVSAWNEGVENLRTTDTRLGGVVHRFLWDSTADVVVHRDSVLIRVTPADPAGEGFSDETVFDAVIGPSTGSFGVMLPLEPVVGTNPRDIVRAEFDGDGVPDLVVVNAGSNNLTILHGDHIAGTPTGSFAPIGTVPVGTAPVKVVVGFFDGDANADLAVVNSGDGTVSILNGAGDGTFSLLGTHNVGTTPVDILAGDLDGDTFSDLAVVNAGGNSVSILIGRDTAGTPNGDFDPAVTVAVGASPLGIAALDVDGDTDADLAVTNQGDNSVMILLNTAGTFAAHANTLVTGTDPADILAVDTNADGFADLVVSNENSENISVFYGNGTPDFAGSATFEAVFQPLTLAAADFNADGIVDVAVTDFSAGEVAILYGRGSFGKGNGTFAPPVGYESIVKSQALLVADVNADGLLDLALAPNPGMIISVYHATPPVVLGNGFVSQVSTAVDAGAVLALTAVDQNADGILDLWASVSVGANTATNVFFGQGNVGRGNGRFRFAGEFLNADGDFALVAADFDEDFAADYVGASTSANQIRVILGTGVSATYATGTTPAAITTGDFNGDGVLDLAVVNFSSNDVSIFLGIESGTPGVGTGTFAAAVNVGVGTNPRGIDTADFDADGDLDLVVANSGSNNFTILTNQGNGTFVATGTFASTGTNTRTVLAADVTGDGVNDLIGANAASDTLTILRGNVDGSGVADGTFDTGSPTTINCGAFPRELALADFDADGILDLAVAVRLSDAVEIFRGNGANGLPDGTFTLAVTIPVGREPVAMVAGDFNGDGRMDLAVGCFASSEIHIVPGQSDEHSIFGAPTAFGTDVLPNEIDRFGKTRAFHFTQRRVLGAYDGGPGDLTAGLELQAPDFYSQLRRVAPGIAGLTVPAKVVPLTAAWHIDGVRRLHFMPDPKLGGAIETGNRFRVENRFGPRTTPASDESQRDGLNLAGAVASQRGIIFDLPIHAAHSNPTIAAGTVRVYMRTRDWLRSSAVSADPMNAGVGAVEFLPHIEFPAASGTYIEYIRERYVWAEIPVDADGDFATGADIGTRFIVDVSDPANRRVRVLSDSGGVFQAFLQAP